MTQLCAKAVASLCFEHKTGGGFEASAGGDVGRFRSSSFSVSASEKSLRTLSRQQPVSS